VSKITALSVQTADRPTTVRAAAPVAAQNDDAERVISTPAPPAPSAKVPAPPVQPIAPSALAVLVQVQSKVAAVAPEAEAHTQDTSDKAAKPQDDPQPAHGEDDQHGHKPPVIDPPPVVQPPVVQPPVVQPPVVQPPVVKPPVVLPPVTLPPGVQPPVRQPPAFDATLPARAIALVERQLADEAASEQGRSAFAAAAAASQAQRTIVQGQVALSVLQAIQSDMAAFRSNAATYAGWGRRGLYA
jgi:hypothetical protein